MPTSDLPTVRDSWLLRHALTAYCTKRGPDGHECGHNSELDLATLIARGHGETACIRLPLVCAACGGRTFTVRAAVTRVDWSSAGDLPEMEG